MSADMSQFSVIEIEDCPQVPALAGGGAGRDRVLRPPEQFVLAGVGSGTLEDLPDVVQRDC
jgi:hypothetical protein